MIRSCGYCFFQRQMKLIYVNRNLGFSMRGDVFVFLCDCRQTRCRWGEIKDKGASFIFKLNYFLQVSVWNRSQTPALLVKRKVRIFNQKVIFSNFFSNVLTIFCEIIKYQINKGLEKLKKRVLRSRK